MIDLKQPLAARLDAAAKDFLAGASAEVAKDGKALAGYFPQLPRRVGRSPLGSGRLQAAEIELDLAAWRSCDAAALQLLHAARATDQQLVTLFEHGDSEERTLVLRCLQALPVTTATVRLLAEAQRTNVQTLFEAATCDGNLLARACGQLDYDLTTFNKTLLKLAFLNLPLARAFGAQRHANPELSRMLQDLATEREAAGRAVWADTNRLIARAPTAGTRARLVGGLEHGDDGQRLAAAEGIGLLNQRDFDPFVRERLAREPRAAIRAALERALQH